MFASKHGKYERKRLSLYIIPARLHLPSAYIRGVKISKNEGIVMGQKGQGCTMREREKKPTSNSSLDFCSVMDPGCKVVRKNTRSKYITVTIHQAGFHLALCVRAWGENNIKEEGSLL